MKNNIYRVHTTVLFISGILIMFVAILAVIGNLLDIREIKEWEYSEMSLPTALCLLAIGFNMIFLAFRLNGNDWK